MTQKQCEMLKCITETGFALDDARLFLDTHPHEEKAMEYYEKLRVTKKRLTQEYAEMFSPLLPDDVSKCEKFMWAEGPWPWQYEANFEMRK